MLRVAIAVILLFGSSLDAQAQGKARARLDSITVHAFLTRSGTLSPDLATSKG